MTLHHTLIAPKAWMEMRRALYELRDVTGNRIYHDINDIKHGRIGRLWYCGLVVGDITFWTEGFFTDDTDSVDLTATKIDEIVQQVPG